MEPVILLRDVSPGNILIMNGVAKLSDFGQARLIEGEGDDGDGDGDLTPQVCTLWYRAPEILENRPYSYPVDMWAFGCVVAEAVMGMPILTGEDEAEELNLIHDMADGGIQQAVAMRLPDGTDEALVELISQLLCYKADSRIAAKAVLGHKYLTSGTPPSNSLDTVMAINEAN